MQGWAFRCHLVLGEEEFGSCGKRLMEVKEGCPLSPWKVYLEVMSSLDNISVWSIL